MMNKIHRFGTVRSQGSRKQAIHQLVPHCGTGLSFICFSNFSQFWGKYKTRFSSPHIFLFVLAMIVFLGHRFLSYLSSPTKSTRCSGWIPECWRSSRASLSRFRSSSDQEWISVPKYSPLFSELIQESWRSSQPSLEKILSSPGSFLMTGEPYDQSISAFK